MSGTAGRPIVIIMAAREETLTEFIRLSKGGDFVWGMDSQYVNNAERLPLTVICCQNSSNQTIPGFVAISLRSDEESYTIILQKVKDHLKNHDIDFKRGHIMIDKDIAERNAVVNCGMRFLLCQFHIMRSISAKICKCFKEKKTECKLKFFQNLKKMMIYSPLLF